MQRKTYESENATVKINRSAELDRQVTDYIINWFVENECFHEEVLMQSDATAVDLMAVLAKEIFKFDVAWKDD